MPMRTIRIMMIVTISRGSGPIMVGDGVALMFAAEARRTGNSATQRPDRKSVSKPWRNRLPAAALVPASGGVVHEQRSQLEQPTTYPYHFGNLRNYRRGCDHRGIRCDHPSCRYEADQQRSAAGNDWAGPSPSHARQTSGRGGSITVLRGKDPHAGVSLPSR